MSARIPSALYRAWWVIADNTSPAFRAFAIVALILAALLGVVA